MPANVPSTRHENAATAPLAELFVLAALAQMVEPLSCLRPSSSSADLLSDVGDATEQLSSIEPEEPR
jgi:hypothetical protein